MYIDYYSNFLTVHLNADAAYNVASTKFVSSSLLESVLEIKNSISSSKINQDADMVISTFNQSVDGFITKIEKIEQFANSYEEVEIAYAELKEELDELKKQDELYKEKVAEQPSKDDSKYFENIDGVLTFSDLMYRSDYVSWESKVNELKGICEKLSVNINDYLAYIMNADLADPTIGAIESTVAKPLPFSIEDYQEIPIEIDSDKYILSGQELDDFLTDNNIPNAEYVMVEKSVILVNDVPITTYAVYDKDCTDEENREYEAFINRSLQYEGKIDTAILARIFAGENTSSIIFEQTPRCDGGTVDSNGGTEFTSAAYCNSTNRNVVMFNHENDYDDYYSRSIIHETGHAYDFTLRYEQSGELCCGISHLENGEINEDNVNLFTYDDNNEPYTWDRIIADEVNYFDSSTGGVAQVTLDSRDEAEAYFDERCLNASLVGIEQTEDGKWNLQFSFNNPLDPNGVTVNGSSSVYNINDYVVARHEYFADAFQTYWDGDNLEDGGMSRLEFLCPETYNALNNLFTQDINSYYGGSN